MSLALRKTHRPFARSVARNPQRLVTVINWPPMCEGRTVYVVYLLLALIVALLTASCDRVKEECEPECCLEPDPGTCEAIYVRYYFDREDEKCRSFTYGGCEGVVPFEKKAECERACEDRPCDCAEDGGAQ